MSLCRRSLLPLSLLVLLAITFALAKKAPHATAAASPQAFDASRQILFVAQSNDGAVRVLNLRNTVGEIAMLRSPTRHVVHDLKLDPSGQWLWVLGDDAVMRYDTRNLKPVESRPEATGRPLHFASVRQESYTLRHEEVLSTASAVSHFE